MPNHYFLKHLTCKQDPNQLEITVNNLDIQPIWDMNNGVIASGFLLKIAGYNTDQVLSGLLEDYGKEKLLEMINQLD